MKNKILLTTLLSLAITACGDSESGSQTGLAAPYQAYFKEAMQAGSQGKLPINECAKVVGTAVGMILAKRDENNQARQAFEACYVDAFVNYANTFFTLDDNAKLDSDNRPQGCMQFTQSLRMHKSSVGGFANKFDVDSKELDQRLRNGLSETAAACL